MLSGGGAGSVRLKPRMIDGQTVWLLAATSTPAAHEGFPLALPEALYFECSDRLSERGVVDCSITGRLKFLPAELDPLFRNCVGVPQVYLLAEEIDQSGPTALDPVVVSGAVIFRSETVTGSSRADDWDALHAAYVSFVPGIPGSLEHAVDWLADTYVGAMYQGEVVTDFDEQTRRFAGAVFSVEKVMSGRLSVNAGLDIVRKITRQDRTIQLFVERLDSLNVERAAVHQERIINIGANTTVNAPVTIADSIEASFNRLEQSSMDDRLKDLLRQLGEAVAVAARDAPADAGSQLANDVDTLTKELSSPSPRPAWYRLALDGLRETAAKLGAVAVPVLEATAAIASLLS